MQIKYLTINENPEAAEVACPLYTEGRLLMPEERCADQLAASIFHRLDKR